MAQVSLEFRVLLWATSPVLGQQVCNSSTKPSFCGANYWGPCMLNKSSPRCAASQSHKSPEQRLMSSGATDSTKSQYNLTFKLSAPWGTARPKVELWKAGACLARPAGSLGLDSCLLARLPVFSVFHNFKTAEALSPGCFMSCSWGLNLGF